MLTSDFAYQLPDELIARYPLTQRSGARLLHVSAQHCIDRHVCDLPKLINAGDLLVVNNTKVIKARLLGQKPTGGKVELLIERVLDDREILAHMGASKKPAIGGRVLIADDAFVLLGRVGELFHLRWQGQGNVWSLMDRAGQLPLPPYFGRSNEASDEERYQSVFANALGAVAAPTASLHFDSALLTKIAEQGAQIAEVTLHVGAGTFQPVRSSVVAEHVMHAERYEVSAATAKAITETQQRGNKVIAVGTTVCRALESAATPIGSIAASQGETRIFITPGYQFKVIDRLFTNFHLPESTLLMLVSAFAGVETIRASYAHAIAQKYRFFSYGDAMLLEKSV